MLIETLATLFVTAYVGIVLLGHAMLLHAVFFGPEPEPLPGQPQAEPA